MKYLNRRKKNSAASDTGESANQAPLVASSEARIGCEVVHEGEIPLRAE
jgi:hypothetical protein